MLTSPELAAPDLRAVKMVAVGSRSAPVGLESQVFLYHPLPKSVTP